MPWTGPQFRKKHAKKLSPGQAKHAADIANAILGKGGDEGVAIATGIARAKDQPMKKGGKRGPY